MFEGIKRAKNRFFPKEQPIRDPEMIKPAFTELGTPETGVFLPEQYWGKCTRWSRMIHSAMGEVGLMTDMGSARVHNEDSMAYRKLERGNRQIIRILVADGMGGHGGGELASGIAAQRIMECPDPELNLATVISNIRAEYQRRGDIGDGGTTFALAQIEGDELEASWAGDSMIIVVREGKIVYCTKPDTENQRKLDAGIFTYTEAAHARDGHMINNGINIASETRIRTQHFSLEDGDMVLTCSDGITDVLGLKVVPTSADGNIDYALLNRLHWAGVLCAKASSESESTTQIGQNLIDLAYEANPNSMDNVSVGVLRYVSRVRLPAVPYIDFRGHPDFRFSDPEEQTRQIDPDVDLELVNAERELAKEMRKSVDDAEPVLGRVYYNQDKSNFYRIADIAAAHVVVIEENGGRHVISKAGFSFWLEQMQLNISQELRAGTETVSAEAYAIWETDINFRAARFCTRAEHYDYFINEFTTRLSGLRADIQRTLREADYFDAFTISSLERRNQTCAELEIQVQLLIAAKERAQREGRISTQDFVRDSDYNPIAKTNELHAEISEAYLDDFNNAKNHNAYDHLLDYYRRTVREYEREARNLERYLQNPNISAEERLMRQEMLDFCEMHLEILPGYITQAETAGKEFWEQAEEAAHAQRTEHLKRVAQQVEQLCNDRINNICALYDNITKQQQKLRVDFRLPAVEIAKLGMEIYGGDYVGNIYNIIKNKDWMPRLAQRLKALEKQNLPLLVKISKIRTIIAEANTLTNRLNSVMQSLESAKIAQLEKEYAEQRVLYDNGKAQLDQLAVRVEATKRFISERRILAGRYAYVQRCFTELEPAQLNNPANAEALAEIRIKLSVLTENYVGAKTSAQIKAIMDNNRLLDWQNEPGEHFERLRQYYTQGEDLLTDTRNTDNLAELKGRNIEFSNFLFKNKQNIERYVKAEAMFVDQEQKDTEMFDRLEELLNNLQ